MCRCKGGHAHPPDSDDSFHDPKRLLEVWNALTNGRLPPVPTHKPAAGQHDKLSIGHDLAADGNSSSSKQAALTESARLEKYVKGRLAVAADHFNRDYKKGFQFLQVPASSRKGLIQPPT